MSGFDLFAFLKLLMLLWRSRQIDELLRTPRWLVPRG